MVRQIFTLIMLKCKRSGNRARCKRRLGSIFPLNSRRKNSVCAGIPIKISVHTESSKKNRVHTEIEYFIYGTGRGKKITGGKFALGHSSTRLRGSTRNRRGTLGAVTNSIQSQNWGGPVGCCSGGVGRQSVQQTSCTGAASETLSLLRSS